MKTDAWQLRLDHVALTYPAVGSASPPPVLRDINLDIYKSESLAIIGPSGSGKTTLLNIIGTLERPTRGKVWLETVNLATLEDDRLAGLRNQKIGFVFQDHHLLPQCTVLENVLVPTLATGRPGNTAETRARKLLDRVGLADRLHHRPGQLSGGERQRVAVVRALINQPAMLLADEPTGSLDRASARKLVKLLGELNREEGVTLVVVTHDLGLAAHMGRALELRDGELHEARLNLET